KPSESQMRQVREDARHQWQIEYAVDDDSKVEVAAAGDETEHAIEEIEDAEQAEVEHRPSARMPGRDCSPETRREVQAVVVEVEREETEEPSLGVSELR